jgi:hypothetical protein
LTARVGDAEMADATNMRRDAVSFIVS